MYYGFHFPISSPIICIINLYLFIFSNLMDNESYLIILVLFSLITNKAGNVCFCFNKSIFILYFSFLLVLSSSSSCWFKGAFVYFNYYSIVCFIYWKYSSPYLTITYCKTQLLKIFAFVELYWCYLCKCTDTIKQVTETYTEIILVAEK